MKCVKIIGPSIYRLSKFINIDQSKVLEVLNRIIFCITYSKNIPSDQKIHVVKIITYVLDNSNLLNGFILMNFELFL